MLLTAPGYKTSFWGSFSIWRIPGGPTPCNCCNLWINCHLYLSHICSITKTGPVAVGPLLKQTFQAASVNSGFIRLRSNCGSSIVDGMFSGICSPLFSSIRLPDKAFSIESSQYVPLPSSEVLCWRKKSPPPSFCFFCFRRAISEIQLPFGQPVFFWATGELPQSSLVLELYLLCPLN